MITIFFDWHKTHASSFYTNKERENADDYRFRFPPKFGSLCGHMTKRKRMIGLDELYFHKWTQRMRTNLWCHWKFWRQTASETSDSSIVNTRVPPWLWRKFTKFSLAYRTSGHIFRLRLKSRRYLIWFNVSGCLTMTCDYSSLECLLKVL